MLRRLCATLFFIAAALASTGDKFHTLQEEAVRWLENDGNEEDSNNGRTDYDGGDTEGETEARGNSDYNTRRGRWRTMKLIVDGAYQGVRRNNQNQNILIESDYQIGDILVGVTREGENTFGNNNIYTRRFDDDPIGISFQACVTPQSRNIKEFQCTWTLSFSERFENQIMAQGLYFNETQGQFLQWPPNYQFVAITGGTGLFRQVNGFIILAPKNLLDEPPKWWYYVVYKLK